MTGRWALLGHGLLALAIVGFVAACGGDDDDDTGGTGGSAGTTMSGSGGSKAGSGGSTAGTGGSGGSMGGITPAMCVTNSMAETPMTPMTCLMCICGKDASAVDKVDAAGWKLIECIGAKCDGVGTSPCVTAAAPAGCGDLTTAGATTAVPTTMAFNMCKMECGIGDMPTDTDGGMSSGDAGL
jgi:hypothetical protein